MCFELCLGSYTWKALVRRSSQTEKAMDTSISKIWSDLNWFNVHISGEEAERKEQNRGEPKKGRHDRSKVQADE